MKKDLKHIKASNDDRGKLACVKTLLYRDNSQLFHKLRLAVDAENHYQFQGEMDRMTEEAYLNGAAIMYELMKNPKFLKDCENIYEKYHN